MSDCPSSAPAPARTRFPPWLRKTLPLPGRRAAVSAAVAGRGLHTVCDEALCPNKTECFSAGTATFLIMGNVCTRRCGFCGILRGAPLPPDPAEPRAVAAAAAALRLSHVVITSVTRDDLPDGGAAHFASAVRECRKMVPGASIEVLVPDFQGDPAAVETVLESRPDVFNHNCETVPRLYPVVRPLAEYRRSLAVLAAASKSLAAVKSGIMAGLGETDEEVFSVLSDLRSAGCSIVTIGQYLRPGPDRLPVQRFVTPGAFERYRLRAVEMGFAAAAAGPFVRSSYRAGAVFRGYAQPGTVMVQ